MKFYSILTSIIFALLITGCNDNKDFTPIKKGESLVMDPECKMGMCSWTKIESINVSPLDKDALSVEIKARYSSTENDDVKPKDWSEGEILKITCSKTAPSYDGTPLNIKSNVATSGAEMSAIDTYFAACHLFTGDVETAKEKYKY
ncbi:hypothetical protein [Arsenophonus sp.]|uniref:hypothetical protein n=1 Tax=Arsenophonus sp. TaxID=1872640 RepID=UPI00387943EE